MEQFEEIVNRVSDMDAEWWPFLFLRPAPEEKMSDTRVFMLATLYGVFFGMLANVLLAFAYSSHRVNPVIFPIATTLTMFLVFRATVATSWNRRAARLAPRASRSSPLSRS